MLNEFMILKRTDACFYQVSCEENYLLNAQKLMSSGIDKSFILISRLISTSTIDGYIGMHPMYYFWSFQWMWLGNCLRLAMQHQSQFTWITNLGFLNLSEFSYPMCKLLEAYVFQSKSKFGLPNPNIWSK